MRRVADRGRDPDRREPVIPHHPIPPETPPPADRLRSRAEDVLKLHRVAHSGGSAALVEWLAARLGGWTGVLDVGGTAGPELAVRGPWS